MNTDNNHKNQSDWEEELKNAPLLEKLHNDQPYEAPAGYFDSLAFNVMSRISEEGNLKKVFSGETAPVEIASLLH